MNKGERARILLVDDDKIVCQSIAELIQHLGYHVTIAYSGVDALALLDESFDVLLLDINMPIWDGFLTMEKVKAVGWDIPVLFLTGMGSIEYALKAIKLGAYDFLVKPIVDHEIFALQLERAVEKRIYSRNEKKYKAFLEKEVAEKTRQLQEQNNILREYNRNITWQAVQLMESMQNALEAKDIYTAGHTLRVTEYALTLGKIWGLCQEQLDVLGIAAKFHDIGKIVIDLSCIQKPGKLTTEEWQMIRRHPEVGVEIIEPFGFIDDERFIIRHHHERIDGNGYPDGLKGEELNDLTKILTIVDSYDAMTSHRNYKRNLNQQEAVEELVRCAGSQFDSDIVECFVQNIAVFPLVENSN